MTVNRLPQHVVPSRYDLRIEPDLAAASFAGTETIEVAVLTPTREIVVNAADLAIRAVTVDGEGGQRLPGTVRLDEAAERAVLGFPEPLQPGRWRLSLEFSGALNDRLRGFYRSTFKASDGRQAALAVT